jgi:PAS domain S-box-containing protein
MEPDGAPDGRDLNTLVPIGPVHRLEGRHVAPTAVSRRQSLRWRLSLLTFSLVAAILVTFLWATHRTVESTVRQAAAQRAEDVANQLSRLLAQSAQQSLGTLRGRASLENVRRFLLQPSPSTRAAAEAELKATDRTVAERWELWTSTGELLLAVHAPSNLADPFPAAGAPRRPGIGLLQVVGDQVHGDVVAEIQQAGAPIGFLRHRSVVRAQTDALERLVGGGATVAIGNQAGDVWLEKDRLSPPPPGDLGRTHLMASVHHREQGFVAAVAVVPDTPWAVWVGFPEGTVLGPAGRFLREMSFAAVVFLFLAAVLIALATRRITQPLAELTEAAASLANGEYDGPIAVRRLDEIGLFAQTFNAMSGQIADAQTQLREQLGELRRTSDRLRAVVASVPMTLWSVNAEGVVALWEGSLLQRIGIDPAAAIGRPAADMDGRLPELAASTRRALTGEPVRWTSAVDGLTLDTQYVPLRDDHGQVTGAIGVAMDVTDRLRLEVQLRQAQKMEAIGQLAGGIAHDFNNLLTAILGYGELLKQEDLPPSAETNVDEILLAGERAAVLTRQLLAFSRQQILQPEILSLTDVIHGIVPMLRRLIGEHVELSLGLDPAAGRVRADAGQMAQVVMNLVINSRDAMPEGGRVTIETGDVQLEEDYVKDHPEVRPGPYVMLAVSDTGHGIDDATRTRIFEPFFTTKERGRGTGLGLATVYGIVKQALGSIWVYSEPGHGTTFKVYLPRTDAPATTRPEAPARAPRRGTETILVVEDEEAVRLLVARLLERAGYKVVSVGDPTQARAQASDQSWNVDLLITDVVMPSGTGPDLFQDLRLTRPDLRVLFISGYAPGALKQASQIPPDAAFLQKPFSAQALLQKVQEVFGVRPTGS